MMRIFTDYFRVCLVTLLYVTVASCSGACATPKSSNMEPVWEKINGEWKFNETTKQKHESLVYVITTTDNKLNKNIITKDMVKLPFVLIIEQDKKEEISLH